MEETFTYDDMNRLTGATKVHALASATTAEGVFPSASQTVTYTGFDKVSMVKQGVDSICYAYGYDLQRTFMEEHVGSTVRTKRYVGNCEYITETNASNTDTQWLTYLSGPTGVYAVVLTKSGSDQIFYILKDNLGSWTAITDNSGNTEQRLSYDAWGNLRNPQTWSGDFSGTPVFDRGFTGHEHLYNFGLINMNGRMYDPVVSSFLSADRFVQSPTTAQGFNRYAYCMNNPLRYVDPTGWLAGGGVGTYGEHPLWVPYYVNDMITIDLPEVTILADNPSLSNTYEYEEFEYTPNITSGGFDNGWGRTKGWSSSGHNGGSGGGNGNHGGRPNQELLGETPPVGATIHTGNLLFLKAYGHYQFGKGRDFWVDASTLKLDYITQNDLSYHDGIATVNLFDYSKTAQSALTLGKIDLTPVGDNLFEIHFDTYNFEIEWGSGWTTRNIGTAISGFIHGPVLDDVPLPTHWMDGKPCYAQPSVYWGGPFKIHFTNCVYIKP